MNQQRIDFERVNNICYCKEKQFHWDYETGSCMCVKCNKEIKFNKSIISE